jgi:hypothetical protein
MKWGYSAQTAQWSGNFDAVAPSGAAKLPSIQRRSRGTRAPPSGRRRLGWAVLAGCVASLVAGGARAQSAAERSAVAGATAIDRVAVRFTAPETGGIDQPQFIFERELAFEARLEALADPAFRASAEEPYVERHVRVALERHMAEVLLERLEITPEPTPRDLELRSRTARLTLAQQVGGEPALDGASQAEGIAASEVARLLARRARASLYLDRMVASMLTPNDTELRIVHRTTRTPFTGASYESIAPMLQRWYVAQRLNAAVRAFYEGARSRIKVTLIDLNRQDAKSAKPDQ